MADFVSLQIPREHFTEMRDLLKMLTSALDAAEKKISAEEKLAESPIQLEASAVDAGPLAGFGAELSSLSNGSMGA